MSDNELGIYLRARREAVTPADVGLPGGPRRRTPGLRRAELATLAGVSVEYLARLEQGRDRHPSSQVLGALAVALHLSAEERFHLRRLTKANGGDDAQLCPSAIEPPSQAVRPTVRALLEQLEPTPAVLLNRLSEILAYTSGYERLAGPLGLLDGAPDGRPPSLLRFLFTDDRARRVYPDWERVADDQVAILKSESLRTDPSVLALDEELGRAAGKLFTDRLSTVTGLPRPTGAERLVHPEVGELRLSYETLELPGDRDQRLLVHLPADDATSAALDRLTGRRPGALHAVSG
ncbi:helix-turn-helix transcriptional regulator [Streptomyces sp. N2-109]|uniref:Helix-turn-helix transcriptional regulator n=1 Tax=Streptomyces gossypii TaxID=2883101 RepID=A0ABT2JPR3_9ACTN|nr:helix-turn-helix transcriptional regulator [Streptomyces gossypii]MCT2589862.1 helix-turn-helix transcriptional regulator [Streptomyces gossypii]